MDKNIKILGVKVNKVNMKEAYDAFLSLLKSDTTSAIVTPNTEMIMMAQKDEELYSALFKSDLSVPDGIGLIYASKIYNLGLTEKVAGVDLMDEILKYSNRAKKKIYLFGGKEGISEIAKEKILKEYSNINIVGTSSGYFNEKEELKIIDLINETKPDILFVALGAGRQEKWVEKNRKILNVSVAMGVGGALDVWAGSVKRAPKLFVKLHLEWFYRLLKQPSRFARMLSIPKFLVKIIIKKETMEG